MRVNGGVNVMVRKLERNGWRGKSRCVARRTDV